MSAETLEYLTDIRSRLASALRTLEDTRSSLRALNAEHIALGGTQVVPLEESDEMVARLQKAIEEVDRKIDRLA
jgi:hypothetical protein